MKLINDEASSCQEQIKANEIDLGLTEMNDKKDYESLVIDGFYEYGANAALIQMNNYILDQINEFFGRIETSIKLF